MKEVKRPITQLVFFEKYGKLYRGFHGKGFYTSVEQAEKYRYWESYKKEGFKIKVFDVV